RQARREVLSQGQAMTVLDAALRHLFERRSVAREGEALNAALDLHPKFSDWRALRQALQRHPDVILDNGELTLASIRREDADTVQRFLISEALQARVANRAVLVDEAGLLSTHQLENLTRIAEERHARVILIGDTKQHYSVQRGDALRHIIEHTHTPVVRLSEVLRQREESDRQFSRLLAAREVTEAFHYAARRGMIREMRDDGTLFAHAAEHYA